MKTKRILAVLLSLIILISSIDLSAVTVSAETVPFPEDAMEFNGHTYMVYDTSLSWSEAKVFCENLGGHLVTINSEEEQQFLIELAKLSSKKNLWIGAKSDKNGTYSWITGETFEYTNWAENEPNNVFNSQFTAMMYTQNSSHIAGSWNDENENGRDWPEYYLEDFGFICEWQTQDGFDIDVEDLKNNYIQQHVDFVNSSTYSNLITNASFYEKIMKDETNEAFVAYGIWEYLGDIGDIATFNIQGLMKTNPYNVILSELFLNYTTIENMSAATNMKI